jgi:hypothetical protein
MQLRIECYEHELPMILNNLRSVFDVKSVSKYYPNTRQTAVETYCEGRVYVKINGLEKDRHNKLIEYMVTDMLQFLSKIKEVAGDRISEEAEIEKIRAFYSAGHMIADSKQLFELSAVWKDALLTKFLDI